MYRNYISKKSQKVRKKYLIFRLKNYFLMLKIKNVNILEIR